MAGPACYHVDAEGPSHAARGPPAFVVQFASTLTATLPGVSPSLLGVPDLEPLGGHCSSQGPTAQGQPGLRVS